MCELYDIKTKYGNVVKVASVKYAAIDNLINSAYICPDINAIILFGSALEERCTGNSDIDIAIISDKSVSGLSSLRSFRAFMNSLYDFDENQEYDRLYFKSMDDIHVKSEKIQICKEIVNKGKVIYRKETA